ncbi:hypothetical protein [Rhodopirellula europaea]|uniref:hypothetical protein n=1 Tax=Rhodopirellula europaea TaxID=1263866 RepID=UPI003D299033
MSNSSPRGRPRSSKRVREDEKLRQRLIQLRGQDVAGLHTIGAIWRRQRLSCPDRSTLQAYVANQLDAEMADYVLFHLTEIGCRVCRPISMI